MARDLDIPPVPSVTKRDGATRGSRTNVFNSGRMGKNVNTKAVKKSDLNKQRGMKIDTDCHSRTIGYNYMIQWNLDNSKSKGPNSFV